jgi:hypothetical protein
MSPALLLSIIMAVFCGSLFHVLLGHRLWQWPLFIGAAIVGFFGGFLAAVAWNAEWLRVGDVPMALSVIGALATMGLAWFFTSSRTPSQTDVAGR